jgi:hypothetical protein
MDEYEFTPWFPANVKPVRVGRYHFRRWYMGSDRPDSYAYWNGAAWEFTIGPGKVVASPSEWRGLAHPPKGA